VERGDLNGKKKIRDWGALEGRAGPKIGWMRERGDHHRERWRTRDGAWERKRSGMSSSWKVQMGETRHKPNLEREEKEGMKGSWG
jgi:hypothetical protein